MYAILAILFVFIGIFQENYILLFDVLYDWRKHEVTKRYIFELNPQNENPKIPPEKKRTEEGEYRNV